MGFPCAVGPGQLRGSEIANKTGGSNDVECSWDVHIAICVDRIEIEDAEREENPFSRGTLERCPDRDDPGARQTDCGVGVRQR
jgi:hypothetical protein